MAYILYNRFIQRVFAFLLASGLLAASTGCAQKGLITEKYSKDLYSVPKLLLDGPMEENPEFIVYGDSRPGWRIQEKYLRKRGFLTWKMLIFPFYEVYWLGNVIFGGINYARRVPDYGIKERRMVRDAVYEKAEHTKVDFIFHLGDMPADGRRPSHWATFLKENKIERSLALDFPFLPVVGNHEKANDLTYGLPNYEAIFEYPQFYVLDFPDAAIFVLDSNLILDQYQFIDDDKQDALFREWFVSEEDSEQPAWLEREMALRKQTFKIVVIHHPPVSFGRHHLDWAEPEWGRDLQKKRQQLLNLFYEKGVRLVLCSHEHLYEHNVVRRLKSPQPPLQGGEEQSPLQGEEEDDEIHVVVTGGGGVTLRPATDPQIIEEYIQNYRAEGFEVSVKQEVIYHYCLVDIASDEIIIQVVEVTGNAEKPPRLAEKIVIPGG